MSFKFHYKWPSINDLKKQTTVQQAINKQTKQEVFSTDQTLGIGITTVVFFIITFLYIYLSAIVKKNSITTVGSFGELFINSCKDLSILNLNTISGSFELSEKIGTTVCLVIFLALLQAVLSYQHIYSNDIKRAPIVAFNYVIILSWLLFIRFTHSQFYYYSCYWRPSLSNLRQPTINCFYQIGHFLVTSFFNSLTSFLSSVTRTESSCLVALFVICLTLAP